MAEIAPLTPLRYDLKKVDLGRVVAPPYDVIDEDGRRALIAQDPHNVVQLILPEGDGDSKYANAAKIFTSWNESGILVRDNEPAFYRYDQTFSPPGVNEQRITRRGFLALVRLRPFSDRVILPHERTLSGPKEDRLKLFRATKTNLSPGFMLYRDPKGQLNAPLESGTLLTEFSTHDGIHHALAKVSNADAMQAITEHVAKSSLLIADGHHRYETALRYSGEVDGTGALPNGAHRYFMVFLCNEDDPNLRVFATHRHVHSLPTEIGSETIDALRKLFDVSEPPQSDAKSLVAELARRGNSGPTLAMIERNGRAWILSLRKDVDLATHPTLGAVPEALRRTDVALLHQGVLEAILGITKEAQAAKTNLWYPQDASRAASDLLGGKGQALFLMNPTPVDVVRRVAEAGEVMPQKSTFFFPKVLTGLAIHTLEPTRVVG